MAYAVSAIKYKWHMQFLQLNTRILGMANNLIMPIGLKMDINFVNIAPIFTAETLTENLFY